MFTIIVTQSENHDKPDRQVYFQTVDSVDLLKLSALINTPPPPAPVAKKKRSDAVRPRAPKGSPVLVSTHPLTVPA